MNHIKAFFLGVYEFRSDFTTNFTHVNSYEGDALQETYDLGREWAHRLTFRHFEQSI